MRAKAYFQWPGMKSDIIEFVTSCDICQRNKGDHNYPTGLLHSLPIPDHAWQHITMDFVEGLPKSGGKDVFMVVVDRLTKYAHFIALSHPFTASTVAQHFPNNVFNVHGLPVSIISGRDKIFTSNFWQDLFTSIGTISVTTSVVDVEVYIKEKDQMPSLLKETLQKAQDIIKIFANKKREDRSFQVGDEVYLKLQPYKQTTVSSRRNLKMLAKYYGHFTVIEKIGAMTYRLQLRPDTKVHPVFHVSHLKNKIGVTVIPYPLLPLVDQQGQFKVKPTAILEERVTLLNNISVPQHLVQWVNSNLKMLLRKIQPISGQVSQNSILEVKDPLRGGGIFM
ncbi:uncharacterized protein LOC113324393 [Papaver somniferum]|uniref:uncharacterized protein LOC113324393 n=1 Tax=Papaver somniferum TaxID=3469 RepID=UPI000E6FA9B2|nr:uncharacterized protein LOC113324393 [Papaver somniferum]